MDKLQAILDRHNVQIVVWNDVPDVEDYQSFMWKNRLTFFQKVIVKTLFDDGSGCVDVSMLIPKQKETGEIIAVWDMSDYARNHNMKITHFMFKPKPPVGTEEK